MERPGRTRILGEALMITAYIGIVDGLHTCEVRDESGVVIGTNASVVAPDGWTLDEATGEWTEAATI